MPLIYEGKFVEQNVDEQNIDLWFEQTTKKLSDAEKQDLKAKWSSIKRLASTDARIKRIALDINNHFMDTYKETGFKAMLATNFKKDAVRYLECFESFGDLGVAIRSKLIIQRYRRAYEYERGCRAKEISTGLGEIESTTFK